MKTRLLVAIVLLFSGFVSLRAGQTTTSDPATVQKAREFWNKEFADDKALRDKEPSKLFVDAVRASKPGTALDLGMGQGRNAVFLAEQGWKVTGVDLSDVAVEQAKKSAAARGVTLNGGVKIECAPKRHAPAFCDEADAPADPCRHLASTAHIDALARAEQRSVGSEFGLICTRLPKVSSQQASVSLLRALRSGPARTGSQHASKNHFAGYVSELVA
jgi:SAM-dependent methyltransferase